MLHPLLVWASCVATVAASLQSCRSEKYEDAFLANVTAPLATGLRRDFCDRGGTDVVVLRTPELLITFCQAASPQKSSANSRNNFKCCRSVKLPLSGPCKHRSRFICGCALYASGKRLPGQEFPGFCLNNSLACAAYQLTRLAGQTSLYEGTECYKRCTHCRKRTAK